MTIPLSIMKSQFDLHILSSATGYIFAVRLSKDNTTLVQLNLPDEETMRYFVDMTTKSILETNEVNQQNVIS